MEFKKLAIVLFWGITVISCTKELPVDKYDRGDAQEIQVAMGSTYDNQVWVDLERGEIIKTAPKTDWDFAFLTLPNQPYLVLNTALSMKAAQTQSSDWNNTFDPNNYTFSADHANGDLDSIRAGQWWDHREVVLIDLGVNASGLPKGYCKIQCTDYENNTLTFRVAQLDGNNEKTVTYELNEQYTQNEYNYYNQEKVQISPQKDSYDLIFTGYMEHFYEEDMEYQVTGVLLNRHLTSAYADTNHTFTEINAAQIDLSKLTFDRHIIGYDWKYYDFDESGYIIVDNAYVVQDQEGFTYKIRFTDFYDESGIKGHPKFEVQLL